MIINKRFRLNIVQVSLLSLSLSLLASTSALAEIYRWVDQNGNVQYGDLPPDVNNNASFDKEGRNTSAKKKEDVYVDQRVQALNKARQEEGYSLEDQVVLSSFSTEEDIKQAENSRLMTINESIEFNKHSIQQWIELDSQLEQKLKATSNKNYTDKRQQLKQWISEANEKIATFEKEKTDIKSTFKQHIERFKSLHSDKNH